MPAPIPFEGRILPPPSPPFPPPGPLPPPGSLPIMAELEWLRSAAETQMRTIKYLLDNYNGLLSKIEGEGITLGEPTFGPAQNFAVGALIPAGRWLVVQPGTVAQALTAGEFVTLAAQGSATTAVSMMPVS